MKKIWDKIIQNIQYLWEISKVSTISGLLLLVINGIGSWIYANRGFLFCRLTGTDGKVPFWYVFIAVTITILAVWLPLLLKKRPKPKFLEVTSTKIGKITWQWTWFYHDGYRMYKVEDIYPICPKCHGIMPVRLMSGGDFDYKCVKNHTLADKDYISERVESFIIERIKDHYPEESKYLLPYYNY